MTTRLSLLIMLIIGTLASHTLAKENLKYDLNSNINFYGAPESPNCDTDCQNYVTSNKPNNTYRLTVSDGETYCITSNFQKLSITIDGQGGKIRICGKVTISSLSFWRYSNFDIEITEGSELTMNVNSWNSKISISNWGTLNSSQLYTNGTINNYGTISVKNLTLRSHNTASLTNTGTITVSSDFKAESRTTINNSGTVTIKDDLSIQGSFTNDGSITVKDEITSTGNITNNSTITAGGNISFNGGTITNSGSLSTDKDLRSYSEISNSGTIDIGDDFYSDKSLNNSGTITVKDYAELERSVSNSGEITVKDDLNIRYCNFTNTESGSIITTDDITITSSPVTNSGEISSGDKISINNNRFTNTDTGTITAGGDLTVQNNNLNNEGSVSAGADVSVKYGSLTNSGNLAAGHNLTTQTDTKNSGTISVTEDYTIKSKLDNSGTIETGGSITNNDWNKIYNSGSISTDENFNQNGSLFNSGDVVVKDTYQDKNWRFTQMEDGATLTTGNLILNGEIKGSGEYSTVTVEDKTNINGNGSVDGNIILNDENGIESNDGNISESVLQDFEPGSDVDTNQIVPFNGSDQYLRVSDNNALDLSNTGTIEIMLKLDAFIDYAGIIHKGDDPYFSDEAYTLQMGGPSLGSSNKNVMFAIVDKNDNATIITSVDQLELNKWYHIVACWDESFAYLYLNGVLQSKIANTITPRNSTGDLVIGAQMPSTRGSGVEYPFSGSMDNIRLWNKCFTGDEVWDTFGTTVTESQNNLLLNLTFEELTKEQRKSYFTSVYSNPLKAYLYNYGNVQNIEDVAEVEDIIDVPNTADGTINGGTYEYLIIENGDNITVEKDLTCSNLIITENGVIYIPKGVTVTIKEDLFIKSKTTGYGQILVEGDINIGSKVHVEHYFIGGGAWQFLTVPTTVTDFSIFGETFNEDYCVFYYDENKRASNGHSSSVWSVPSELNPGKGYIFLFAVDKSVIFDISATEYFDANHEIVNLNYTSTGRQSDEGWNLIGNPFQSVVSWDKVIAATENDIFNNGGAGAAIYFYDNVSGNYQSYVSGAATNGLDGKIGPMDAFFVKSLSNGSKFKMKRSFFPTTLVTRCASLELDESLTVTLSNKTSSDQTVLRFKSDATPNIDAKYDAYKEFGSSKICQIYTQSADSTSLSINTLSSDLTNNQEELFIKCPSTGNYSLHFENIESFYDEDLYLIDKKDGIIIDLKEEDKYSFSTEKTGVLNRFLIVSKNTQITTSISNEHPVVPFYYYNRVINILDNSLSDRLAIFDTLGKMVFSHRTEANTIRIPLNIPSGLYIVKIGNVSQKILVK